MKYPVAMVVHDWNTNHKLENNRYVNGIWWVKTFDSLFMHVLKTMYAVTKQFPLSHRVNSAPSDVFSRQRKEQREQKQTYA